MKSKRSEETVRTTVSRALAMEEPLVAGLVDPLRELTRARQTQLLAVSSVSVLAALAVIHVSADTLGGPLGVKVTVAAAWMLGALAFLLILYLQLTFGIEAMQDWAIYNLTQRTVRARLSESIEEVRKLKDAESAEIERERSELTATEQRFESTIQTLREDLDRVREEYTRADTMDTKMRLFKEDWRLSARLHAAHRRRSDAQWRVLKQSLARPMARRLSVLESLLNTTSLLSSLRRGLDVWFPILWGAAAQLVIIGRGAIHVFGR